MPNDIDELLASTGSSDLGYLELKEEEHIELAFSRWPLLQETARAFRTATRARASASHRHETSPSGTMGSSPEAKS